ncbi:MAG: pyridoxamine 5'-phosphate oxidase family protein, partial [Serratia inhibens]|uniref:pyridoxamine 5'-phosphate oxidase family protein n=1 Tax=Serratia inhibens TaxID=2338073 RepID=UPI003C7C0DA9
MAQPLFHPDEVRAQALAGFDRVGAGIYTAMPEQHREFFTALPYLFVATLDDQDWPVATLFSGPPGFLRTPDDTHLRISAPRRNDDPAQAALQSGKLVGALGLDFSNRRRNRANGVIGRTDKNRIEIEVRQSVGNCPQYIQRRDLYPVAAEHAPSEYLPVLDAGAQALIR